MHPRPIGMPMDVPYKVDVPQREATTLKAPRAVPMPGKGANNPRTFGLCPKLAEARNGSSYVNQISMLGRTGRERDRELLILRMGWNSQSEYEWSEHVGRVGSAREMGLPIERITMGPDAPGWDPFEANLLRFVDEMYRDSVVSDRIWACFEATLRRPAHDRCDDHPGELPNGLAGPQYSGCADQSWRRETTGGAVTVKAIGTNSFGGRVMKRSLVLGLLIAVGGFSMAIGAVQDAGRQGGRGGRGAQPEGLLAADAGQWREGRTTRLSKLRDNVYRINNTGSNLTVFVTDAGAVMVESGYPGWTADVLAKIKSVTDQPLVMVINTHAHGDHASMNPELGKLAGRNIEWVAQDYAARMMGQEDCSTLSGPGAGACNAFKGENRKYLPGKTVKDKLALKVGNLPIELAYYGPAHTGGDIVVSFPTLRIAHVGDLFAWPGVPRLFVEDGGSTLEFPETLRKAQAGTTEHRHHYHRTQPGQDVPRLGRSAHVRDRVRRSGAGGTQSWQDRRRGSRRDQVLVQMERMPRQRHVRQPVSRGPREVSHAVHVPH